MYLRNRASDIHLPTAMTLAQSAKYFWSSRLAGGPASTTLTLGPDRSRRTCVMPRVGGAQRNRTAVNHSWARAERRRGPAAPGPSCLPHTHAAAQSCQSKPGSMCMPRHQSHAGLPTVDRLVTEVGSVGTEGRVGAQGPTSGSQDIVPVLHVVKPLQDLAVVAAAQVQQVAAHGAAEHGVVQRALSQRMRGVDVMHCTAERY